jgi:hypothetical protein
MYRRNDDLTRRASIPDESGAAVRETLSVDHRIPDGAGAHVGALSDIRIRL